MIAIKGLFRDGKLVADETTVGLPQGNLEGHPHLAVAVNTFIDRAKRLDDSFVWIALFDPSQPELELVRDHFDLPQLEVDDAANPKQRAKVELYEGRAFIVIKLLEYVEESSAIETSQISMFVGQGYVVTVRWGSSGDMGWVLDQLSRSELVEQGSLSVVHAVMDRAVDDYLQVADDVALDIEEIEASVFSPTRTDDSASIYSLKRENLEIRRAIGPLMLIAEQRWESESRIPEEVKPYFQDISDHILRASDTVEQNDSLLMTMLMAETAQQDLHLNRDVRRISAWVAIAAVPTMIAGIYGMNFDDMPELHQWWGYPAILAVMFTVCTTMYVQFRKSGWL